MTTRRDVYCATDSSSGRCGRVDPRSHAASAAPRTEWLCTANGYTLIETLAVVALLTLGVTLLTPMLLGAGASSRLDSAVVRFLDLDARGRLLAQSEGGVVLRRDDTGRLLVECREDEARAPRVLTFWRPPAGVDVTLRSANGDRLERLTYDARGRSDDVVVVLKTEERRRAIRVAGLTGWAEVQTMELDP